MASGSVTPSDIGLVKVPTAAVVRLYIFSYVQTSLSTYQSTPQGHRPFPP